MRYKGILFCISILLVSCINDDDKAQPSNVSSLDVAEQQKCYFDVVKWKKEILHIDSLTFSPSIDIENVKIIDFEKNPNTKVNHPNITLEYQTPASKISELFPESSKLIVVNGNAWSGHIELFVSDYDFDSRRWFLIFKAQKLTHLVLYDFPWGYKNE